MLPGDKLQPTLALPNRAVRVGNTTWRQRHHGLPSWLAALAERAS